MAIPWYLKPDWWLHADMMDEHYYSRVRDENQDKEIDQLRNRVSELEAQLLALERYLSEKGILPPIPEDPETHEWYYIDEDGKRRKVSDSARYKAIGNSIATPFWFYLLRRISAQYERPATMGSLFSGIGGFEYCWEKCNGKGTALFASEIEPFCIAVTKEHFSE